MALAPRRCSRGPPWPQVRPRNPERRQHPSPARHESGEGTGVRATRPANAPTPRPTLHTNPSRDWQGASDPRLATTVPPTTSVPRPAGAVGCQSHLPPAGPLAERVSTAHVSKRRAARPTHGGPGAEGTKHPLLRTQKPRLPGIPTLGPVSNHTHARRVGIPSTVRSREDPSSIGRVEPHPTESRTSAHTSQPTGDPPAWR